MKPPITTRTNTPRTGAKGVGKTMENEDEKKKEAPSEREKTILLGALKGLSAAAKSNTQPPPTPPTSPPSYPMVSPLQGPPSPSRLPPKNRQDRYRYVVHTKERRDTESEECNLSHFSLGTTQNCVLGYADPRTI